MKNGFVLTEFVIALPLLILLLFALGQITLKIFTFAKNQAADYVLETETQEILERITADARAAQTVKISTAVGNHPDLQEIFFNYRVLGNNLSKDYFQNKNKKGFTTSRTDILNLIYTQRYTVSNTRLNTFPNNNPHGYYIYAERKPNGALVNPISGGNFFGDTVVTQLKFSQSSQKVLHIVLEMQSERTKRKIKVSTSVFMPNCEKVEIKL